MNEWLNFPVVPKEAITFTVPGKPVPKERPRHGKGNTYTPKRTKDYENVVGFAAMAARAVAGRDVLKGPLYLFLLFKMPKPKKPKYAYPASVPDKDNLEKIYSDAMNGIVYQDDAQIVAGTQWKIYSDEPGVEVAIWEIGAAA